MASTDKAPKDSAKHGAGAFDVRNIIGALLGLYGIVLVILGIIDVGSTEVQREAGINSNLWTGIGLVIFAALMMLWAYFRPIRPEDDGQDSAQDSPGA